MPQACQAIYNPACSIVQKQKTKLSTSNKRKCNFYLLLLKSLHLRDACKLKWEEFVVFTDKLSSENVEKVSEHDSVSNEAEWSKICYGIKVKKCK